jgi:heat shock protein HtpX
MSPLHQSHKQRNRFHTTLLIANMLLLLLLLCLSLFGSDGVLLMLFAFGLLVLFTPRASAWLTLRLHHARQLPFDAAPNLYRIVEQLSQRAGLEQHPLLFYIPSATPNAFAMLEGDQPLIAVTDALLNRLNQAELTAVLAHEISHIRNGDLVVMMFADLLNRLTSSLSTVGWLMLVLFLPVWLLSDVMLPWLAIVLLLLAPLASTLLQLALSRTREFDADLDAAELTGDPATLATALMKIEQSHDKWWFLLLPSRHSENPAWTRTHPSTAERVRRLRALAAEQYRRHDRSSGFISPGSLLMLPVHRLGIWY